MVAIDTDVLILAFAFHRDERQEANTRFLTTMQADVPAVTIYTVMELLGKLSFNLSPHKLTQWTSWLQDYYQLTVLFPQTDVGDASSFFQREMIDQPLARMQQRGMPFLDSLILNLAEAAQVDSFVTWNARHFVNKTALTIITPAEYLERASKA